MFRIFHFLQPGMGFEIVNSCSCIFLNAICGEKSCLISVLFLTCYERDVGTVKFFSPVDS